MKFRPQAKSRYRGPFGAVSYNFQSRRDRRRSEPLNQVVISRIFSRMHYLTAHAPMQVRRQYDNMNRLWHKKLNPKGSITFVNKHSLNRFL